MPRLSVGICAHNEAKNIGALLNAILEGQQLDPEYTLEEVIVVSSGSTDGTAEIVRRNRDPRIKLIVEEERKGKSHAQNLILSEAKGDIIILISADTLPSRDAIIRLARALNDEIGGASGRTISLNKNSGPINFASRFIWELHNQTNKRLAEKGVLSHLGGDMIAIRSGIVRRIPEEIVNDDAFIGMCVRKKGYKVVNVPEAKVYILGPSTVTDYIQQRKRIIYGHRQIKRYFSEKTTIFESLILNDPLMALRIFAETCSRFGLASIIKVPFVISLELIAQLASRTGKGYLSWTMIGSTKGKIEMSEGDG